MNEIFMLYLFTRLDALSVVLGLLCIALGITTVITMIMAAIMTSDGDEFPKMFIKIWYVFGFIVFLNIVVPTKQDVAVILAGSTLMSIARTEEAQRITGKSVQVVEQYLDALLEKKK